MENKFTHFDMDGNARMVDVTKKEPTIREAYARGTIMVGPVIMGQLRKGAAEKGDVLSAARIAGIMAAKRTSELIPLCHPLMLGKCSVDFELDTDNNSITVLCNVMLEGKTGVEMEALTGASVALLTIYDMCKALDKGMVIEQIYLVRKTGGKSGLYEVSR